MKYIRKLFSSKGEYNFIGWFVVGSCIIMIVTCAYPYVLKRIVGLPCAGEMGQYGDVYGGLNTLFTGLAFVGLGVTIWLQIKERKGQNIQSYKEDIYRRISIVKELEQAVKYTPEVPDAVSPNIGVVSYRDRDSGPAIGAEAIHEVNAAIQAIFASFEAVKHDTSFKNSAEEKAVRVFNSIVWIKPWLNTLSDLLCDIIEYFHDDPDEIRRYFRVVFNSSSIHAQGLLILFRFYEVRQGLIPLLIEKKYIDPNVCLSTFTHDVARQKIVMSYIYRNINYDEALIQIRQLQAARAVQKHK